jgi:hypothetical protein
VPNSTHRHFQSFSRKFVSFLSSRTATGLPSKSAFSGVPVANVLACRHSFSSAKRRAGSSLPLTSLSCVTRVSWQHTARLGQLSPVPDPNPSLVSFCFPWLLPIATYRLPKSPCRMRHMEQSRRVAVDNLVPDVSLAAYPRTGRAWACTRTYALHAIDSFLLLPMTPRLDSSVTNPFHNQLCSTPSHHRCWPPAGRRPASPPRLRTSLTGAHFAPPPFTRLPFRNRSLRPASRHIFSALTILSTPHPSKNAVRPHSFSKSYFSASQYPLALTL